MAGSKLGVICSGSAYQYVKEALPEASVLKLGMVYPLPRKLIEEFAASVDELVVIEDMEPFFEDAIKSWGIPCSGKDKTGLQGELFVRKIASSSAARPTPAPRRPPACPPGPRPPAPAAPIGPPSIPSTGWALLSPATSAAIPWAPWPR